MDRHVLAIRGNEIVIRIVFHSSPQALARVPLEREEETACHPLMRDMSYRVVVARVLFPPAPRLNKKRQDGRSSGKSERNRATREKSERGKMVTRGPPFVTNVCFASLLVESFYIVSRSKSYLVPANIYTVIQLASPLITRQGTLMRLLILFHVVRFCISLFKHSPARVPISCIVLDEQTPLRNINASVII